MNKINVGNTPLVYPIPAVLAGTMLEGKANYTLLGNCGIISVHPSVIYISSRKTHCLNSGIHENRCFSVNIPSVNQVTEADYCGLVSGTTKDKSRVFETYFAESDKIPLILECPVNLSCKVIEIVCVHDMELFIAEVLSSRVSEDCLTDGVPDTKKINPLIYTMDNQYWNIGGIVEQAFSAGRNYNI
jgi:flavin reductase (DIM6/NTAB) family NADH-FMN oxidoreductase RutF